MKAFFEALRSGWRAGLKQFRKRRTELARGPVIVTTKEAPQQ
jgi:hypothetical protein